MAAIDVIGGGPAGTMAAMAARLCGADVRLFEKSTFPRHKVCGEFLSPEAFDVLRRVGCGDELSRLGPATIRGMELHFDSRVVRRQLPAPAYGLSRHALDRMLLDRAVALGVQVIRETMTPRVARRPLVVAHGRSAHPQAGTRLFGFKAHFRRRTPEPHPAPQPPDTVALYFFDRCYVGVSAVETGAVNVCGLAPEAILKDCAFQPERLLQRCRALSLRVESLEPAFDWLMTGPLVMGLATPDANEPRLYPAGDALGFIDPFTGSGILNAMRSGIDAGEAAAKGLSADAYLESSRRALRRPFMVSTLFRAALRTGWAGPLASLVPGAWLFRLTRPAV